MTRNRPAGWAGFIALRRRPMTQPKRHGNRKHGHWTKAGIASARELRMLLVCWRSGGRVMPPPQPVPLGWRGFVRKRA